MSTPVSPAPESGEGTKPMDLVALRVALKVAVEKSDARIAELAEQMAEALSASGKALGQDIDRIVAAFPKRDEGDRRG